MLQKLCIYSRDFLRLKCYIYSKKKKINNFFFGGNEKPTGNFDKKLAINQFGKIEINEIQKAQDAHTKNS